jgi:hypothetical protein
MGFCQNSRWEMGLGPPTPFRTLLYCGRVEISHIWMTLNLFNENTPKGVVIIYGEGGLVNGENKD